MGGSSKKTTTVKESDYLRIQELSYESTLQVASGSQTAQGLAAQTSSDFDDSKSAQAAFTDQNDVGAKSPPGEGEFFVSKDWKSTTTFSEGGYQYSKSWFRTRLDRARYVVGIKELEVRSDTYEVDSELISVDFRVPGTISRVSLLVDQQIPELFKTQDPTKNWIEYFFSLDAGKNWVPISPQSESPSENQSATLIPILYHINSTLPEEARNPLHGFFDVDFDPTQIRMKARFIRPTGQDFERYTPILNSYKFRMTVERSGDL